MFDFVLDLSKLDDRSKFANYICQLIVDKYSFSIEKIFNEVNTLKDYLDEHVRNIYELIEDEIPLLALYCLMDDGKDNYDFDDIEYNDAKVKTLSACVKYYNVTPETIKEWEKEIL